MHIFYQKNKLLLRRAYGKDCPRLAARLRPEDWAELAAAFPGQTAESLLQGFLAQSTSAFVLEYAAEPIAMFGLAPDTLLGRRACVWLLTGRGVERVAKTFLWLARRWLSTALTQYEELYNFADERYGAALRFIRRLGGKFDGRYCRRGCVKFLHFTFRRK